MSSILRTAGAWITMVVLLALGAAACAPARPPQSPEQATPSPSNYLPIVPKSDAGLVQPADLEYLGAFRLPAGGDRPLTFSYGGGAMTFNPNGDPGGGSDGFPGSLFIMGHDRLPYGELPNGNQVAELGIPAPVISGDLNDLNTATFVQPFQDVAAGHFTALEELPRTAMLYLDHPATGPKIHLAWGQHLQPDPPAASHGWFDPNLAAPDMQGEWFIGDRSLYSVNGYMIEIPSAWAEAHANGRYVGTGRYRDGGWSGMGPALFAYLPWQAGGAPPPSGTHLPETALLHYESSEEAGPTGHAMAGYQHPDEWEGGAWLTTSSGKTALLFAGNKSNGAKYWYGWANPAGPHLPCVEEAMTPTSTVCYLANGTPCPPEDLHECAGHNDFRGWWTPHWDAQIILYDPADLARVAAGEIPSWQPQPYAAIDIDEYLFLNPAGVEEDMLGTGDQRRYRIGEVAYDRADDLLYILEMYADGTQPVVHVWRVH